MSSQLAAFLAMHQRLTRARAAARRCQRFSRDFRIGVIHGKCKCEIVVDRDVVCLRGVVGLPALRRVVACPVKAINLPLNSDRLNTFVTSGIEIPSERWGD